MMARRSITGGDAPALCFLLVCIGGWMVLRVAAHWNPAVPTPPSDTVPPWFASSPFDTLDLAGEDAHASAVREQRLAAIAPQPRHMRTDEPGILQLEAAEMAARAGNAARSGIGRAADLHSLRFVLMAQRLPPQAGSGGRSAVGGGGAIWAPLPAAARADPGRGKPFWMRRQMAGWSLTGWLYLREGEAATPDTIAATGQLGGSQAGMRIAYGFGATGRARIYGRATLAVRRPKQRELALGMAFAPIPDWPIDAVIEHRFCFRPGRAHRACCNGHRGRVRRRAAEWLQAGSLWTGGGRRDAQS